MAILFMIIGLGLVGWLTGRARAAQAGARLGTRRAHSRPQYHGWYVALWTVVPALLFLSLWGALSPNLVTSAVLADPAAAALPAEPFIRSAILGEARGLATGALQQGFNPKSAALVEPYRAAMDHFGGIGIVV
ncbi:MAG: phosphate ABC transporter permease family protein, partial [Sphingopyxis sp.]